MGLNALSGVSAGLNFIGIIRAIVTAFCARKCARGAGAYFRTPALQRRKRANPGFPRRGVTNAVRRLL